MGKNEKGYIEELRQRILAVAAFFVLAFIVSAVFAKKIVIFFLGLNTPHNVALVTLNPYENITLYLHFIFFISLALTIPFLIYHMVRFISPGLMPNERRAAYVIPAASFVLFLFGAAFGFFMVKKILVPFLSGLALELGVVNTWSISQYFSFIIYTSLLTGIVFQLPLVLIGLIRFRIVTPEELGSFRKHIYVSILLLCAIATPPDLLSMIMLSIPLFLLFEGTLVFAKVFK